MNLEARARYEKWRLDLEEALRREVAADRSERCAAYRKSANTFGTIAVVGYVVAGAVGVTSVALFTEPLWNGRGASASGAVLGVSGAF